MFLSAGYFVFSAIALASKFAAYASALAFEDVLGHRGAPLSVALAPQSLCCSSSTAPRARVRHLCVDAPSGQGLLQ
eukprot:285702-Alexandrium_andersonii.AAC.1